MSKTFQFGNGEWAVGKETALAYNDENSNFKPLPFTFDRASSATRVNKEGLIETVGTDEPRIDFLNNTKGHLLLEPSRQNLVTYSEDFSDASWTTSNTSVSSNQTTSPDGSVNADKLTDNATSNIHRIRDAVSLSASTDYSLSVFAKKDTLSNIQLALINTSNSNTISKVFDLENGIIGEELSQGGTTVSDAKIENFGNGWYRCTIVGQLGSTPNQYQISLATKTTGNSDTSSQVTYSGDGTGSVFLYGAQLEEGSYATSYIPTSGQSGGVTRSAETCSGAGNSTVFNDSEGVLYMEIAALTNDLTFRAITISDGTINNRISIRYRTTSNVINCLISGGGSAAFNVSDLVADITEFAKVALKYKSGDIAVWINGFETTTDVSTFTITGLDTLSFDRGDEVDDFYGKIKDVRVYNTALTDAQLIALTS